MPSPHLLKDLRLLHLALLKRAPREGAEFQDLFEPVFKAASDHASRTLKLLCNEAADCISSAELPAFELFRSPIADQLGPLGVRVTQQVQAGRLMCIYPGRIFLGGESSLPPGDKLFTNEYEGVHMDGKGWLPACWKEHPVLKDQLQTSIWHGNRLAIGNLLNHPSAGQLPNCVPMPFWWPAWQGLNQATPAYWARLIPHVVVQGGQIIRTASGEKPGSGSTPSRFPPWPHMGMAFFSILPLSPGEELFLNYRLSPPFPSWYSPVDDAVLEGAVKRRLLAE
eukprot:TRINITY_DN33719_c0_g1_i2.p1 TRINITY_DN33719_c0_g1~~TRINITY_DN33719_c0_g1_i2.p1  ORF type:complete len:281 (-),score=50.17 TRINITY_DN33719_c0_g1_i2:46-888(-)